jgi:hypothetical protein
LSARSYATWRSDFAGWLYRNAMLDLRQASREQRDAVIARIHADYAPKVQRLEEKIRNAQQVVQREEGQERNAQLQTAISVGATVLDAFLGRKRIRSGTLGRATTAARGVGRAMEQQQDVARAREDVQAAQQELTALNAELEQRVATLDLESVRPSKSDVDVKTVVLAWVPYWRGLDGTLSPAWG